MLKTKTNKLFKRSFSMLFTLLFLIYAVLIGSTDISAEDAPPFNARNPAHPSQLTDIRWTETLVECLHKTLINKPPSTVALLDRPQWYRENGVTFRQLSKSEVESFSFFDTDTVKVGYDIEPADGIVSCREAASLGKDSVENLFGSTADFIKVFYNYSENGTSTTPAQTYSKKTDPSFYDYLENNVFNSNEYRWAQLAIAGAKCIKDRTSTTLSPYDPGPATVIVSSHLQNDNEYTCSTLINLYNTEGIASWLDSFSNTLEGQAEISQGVLRNNPHFLYQAISVKAQSDGFRQEAAEKLKEVFQVTPGPLEACWDSALLNQSSIIFGTGVPSKATRAAEYLTGIISDLDNDSSSTIKEESFVTCIKDSYGGFVTNILDELNEKLAEIDASPVASSSTSSADSDTDKCLEGDSVLGWIVCPIIEKIQGTLGALESYIKSMLKFDLADAGGQGSTSTSSTVATGGVDTQKEIHASWNIFRSLASILILIGFLTALTVKAIRGE